MIKYITGWDEFPIISVLNLDDVRIHFRWDENMLTSKNANSNWIGQSKMQLISQFQWTHYAEQKDMASIMKHYIIMHKYELLSEWSNYLLVLFNKVNG